jgi:hypothetical protein
MFPRPTNENMTRVPRATSSCTGPSTRRWSQCRPSMRREVWHQKLSSMRLPVAPETLLLGWAKASPHSWSPLQNGWRCIMDILARWSRQEARVRVSSSPRISVASVLHPQHIYNCIIHPFLINNPIIQPQQLGEHFLLLRSMESLLIEMAQTFLISVYMKFSKLQVWPPVSNDLHNSYVFLLIGW